MSEWSIKSPHRSNSLGPGVNCISNAKTHVKYNGSCLKQEKINVNKSLYSLWNKFMAT